MWSWMQDNTALLNALSSIAMLVIWLAYLQLFLTSFLRSNRAVVHIGMATEGHNDGRCLVSNMSADSLYILGIMVELECKGEVYRSLVTDRIEADEPLGGDFRERTNQGPLKGGEAVDIGSFRNIGERVARNTQRDIRLDDCDWIEFTVMVAAQQAHKIYGGKKRYEIEGEAGSLSFRSADILTSQIRSFTERRRLRRMLAA
ncbi:hypothetical protein [Salipiger mucosus]|uniref:Uncharacterized protein n=1 Tax=Salipiger mucosus DSM 16094 TaxID=1123237 RepID=S9QRU5_9RHOB|nr:hypothetical protein [Salipiger mucosus]EPX82362.1 hypothetical protein Salmuc_04087 [Salipiger mucosus DSM 16094]